MAQASNMQRGTHNILMRLKRIGIVLCILFVMVVVIISGLLLHLALVAYPVEFDREAAQGISYEPWRSLIPGPGLPEGLEVMAANNNLDITCYQGFFYIAFRTAPTHFASDKTRLLILRSADRKTWEHAGEFQVKRDIREPRFLLFKDTLFLYYFQAGTHPLKFEPQRVFVTSCTGGGQWTEPVPVFRPGYVVWRARTFGNTAYMSVYYGAGLYTTEDRPGDLRLLVSEDGYAWRPVSEMPQVDRVSAEEGEFIFDDEGNLYATVRLETGGGLVCRASKHDLARWKCEPTNAKYDSALLFRHGHEFYVIARRNVAGPFAVGADWMPRPWRRAWWMVRYSLTRKRTALYHFDTAALTLSPLLDFPSKGDTAFAGIVPLGPDTYWVANYSSSLDGPDWPWVIGQVAGTNIYESILHFMPGNSGTDYEISPRVKSLCSGPLHGILVRPLFRFGTTFLRTNRTLQLRFNLVEKSSITTGTAGAGFFAYARHKVFFLRLRQPRRPIFYDPWRWEFSGQQGVRPYTTMGCRA